MRIYFRDWGHKNLNIPSYAIMRKDDWTTAEAVSRSIARANSLSICGGPREDHTNEDGHCVYQFTLGKPCQSGGYNVVAECWVSIPPLGRKKIDVI